MVLLHGWANTWEAWLPLIPYLSDKYQLIIPDLPGFGDSDGPTEGWNTLDYADWLSEFLDQISPQNQVILVGHSYGGKIAAVYASRNSVQLEKLILIDASGIPGDKTLRQKLLAQFASITPHALKRHLSSLTKGKIYEAFGAETDYISATESQKYTLGKILSEDIRPLLPRISIPTLLIWGSQKKFPPLAHGQEFHRLIRHSKLSIYDSGHFPHHDFPTKVASEIIDFSVTSPSNLKPESRELSIPQPLETLLALLQQSEYEWPTFLHWFKSQTTTLRIHPKNWTLKLKLLKFLVEQTKFLSHIESLRFWNQILRTPQTLIQEITIAFATWKLRLLQLRGLAIIAIAGSYAKTSTKNITFQALKNEKKCQVTPGNINTLYGIAREVLVSLSLKDQVFIAELGEYNPGDIKRFVHLLSPDIKILTPMGVSHLERFGSQEKLYQEFFDFLSAKKKAFTIIHENNKEVIAKKNRPGFSYYGDTQIINVEYDRAGTEATIQLESEKYTVFIPLLGKHNISNVLPTLLIAKHWKLDLAKIISRLRSLEYIQYRLEPQVLEHNILILNNGYNSNPQSALESLEVIKQLSGSQRIVITPGFVELGTIQQEANFEFGKQLAEVCDYVIVMSGQNQEALTNGLTQAGFPTTKILKASSETEAMEKLRNKLKPNAIILFENSLLDIYKTEKTN